MEYRWLDLSGCDNTRDLGGLPTVDGRTTRPGVLLRSDTLQELTPEDVRTLLDDVGVRTVIDLRNETEAEREGRGPLASEPVAYHSFSFIPGPFLMPDEPGFDLIIADLMTKDRVDHYLDYLLLAGDAVAGAISVLSRPDTTPAVFHCAAGKDRTGVLAALVLDLVGVERDAVVADFVLTNERLGRVDERLARMPSYRPAVQNLDLAHLSCRPEVMHGFFDAVDRTWGGSAAWATQHGITDADLTRLRDILVA